MSVNMANHWYYANDEVKLGPLSSAQLKELAGNGQLLPSHTVWKEGIVKGVLAARVKNLFPVTLRETPPAPEAPSLCVPALPKISVPDLAQEAAPPSSPGE